MRIVTWLLAATLFLAGVTGASTLPYRAVVAIEGLGFSTTAFAWVMMVNAGVTAVMSLAMGNLSDRMRDRRHMVLFAAGMGAVAYGLVYLVQAQWAYLVAFCLILPLGGTLMSQSLAFSRAYYDRNDPTRAAYMTSLLRTMFSVAWVVVPPLAGWIAGQFTVVDVFLLAALSHLGCTAIFLYMLRRPEALLPPTAPQEGGPRFWQLLGARQWVGVLGILGIRTAIHLHATVLPLAMITDFRGSYTDLGWTSGLAAALEVPFMLMWGWLALRMSKDTILIGTSALFAAYLAAISLADAPATVLWLQLPNAVATAALVSLTITWMQELIRGRVGLSTSMLDVVNIAASLLSAGLFGLVASKASYVAGFQAAAAMALVGALGLALSRGRQGGGA